MIQSKHCPGTSPVKSATIKARIDEIGPLSESMAQAVVHSEDDQDLHFRVNIALTEAITNSVVHGCNRRSSDSIRVEYELKGQDHIFHIFDPGEGPCPDLLEHPTLSDDPLAETHRGMVIMKWASDEMYYKLDDGFFCLTMVFRSRKNTV